MGVILADSACRVTGVEMGRGAIPRIDSIDCDQIWCVVRDQVVMHITEIIGGTSASAHVQMYPTFISRERLDGLR